MMNEFGLEFENGQLPMSFVVLVVVGMKPNSCLKACTLLNGKQDVKG